MKSLVEEANAFLKVNTEDKTKLIEDLRTTTDYFLNYLNVVHDKATSQSEITG